jgi:hypothetical protein
MVLIQLLLPTTSGIDGDATTPLAETRHELADKFKGLTAYVRSPAKGLWTAPDGRMEADDVLMVEVVTETFDRRWWRAYAATLAQRFRQQTIHVRALPVEMPARDARTIAAAVGIAPDPSGRRRRTTRPSARKRGRAGARRKVRKKR